MRPIAKPCQAPPIELTSRTAWEYRAVAGRRRGVWRASVAQAVRRCAPRPAHIDWPARWTVFGVVEERDHALPPADVLASIPRAMEIEGHVLHRRTRRAGRDGVVELTRLFGAPRNGRTAYLFAELAVARAAAITVHAGADYWMEWFLDGRGVYSTRDTGNRWALTHTAHEFDLDLSPGRHVLAVRVASGAGGWALVSEATRRLPSKRPPRGFALEARRAFSVPDPARFSSLTFVGPEQGRPLLNGREIPEPLPARPGWRRMLYERVPAVTVSMLRRGRNVLTRRWDADESWRGALVEHLRYFHGSCRVADGGSSRYKLRAEGALLGLTPQDASVQTGPVLTWLGSDFASLTCRTNMIVPIRLTLGQMRRTSAAGLIHRFVVRGLQPATEYPFTVAPVANAGQVGPGRCGEVRTLPAGPGTEPVTFAVLSDCGPKPEIWRRTAEAVLQRRPALAVFIGDMVGSGRHDTAWDRDFLGKAPDFFSHVPFYAVHGNHDQHAALYERMFLTPGGGRNWAQRIGNALLIGVDGMMDWSPGGRCARWLRRQLAGSDAAFTFLFNHYPAWSSGPHGRLGPDGRPAERDVRLARDVVVPLLTEHRATAMFSGHDHFYERSELPGGLTAIVTGGAGAYLYVQRRGQNPYCRRFVSTYHYCLIRLEQQRCTLRAIDLDGNEVDRRVWAARDPAPP